MRTLPLLAALAILPATLPAQGRPNTREGFWIGFGFGPGSAGTDCSSCTTDRISGFTGYLRMGGTISPKLLLGGESNGWVHNEGNVDESMSSASFIAMWYPSATGALYLKFGIGGMAYSANDGVDEVTATAGSFSLGIGYEIRAGRNFSVTPFLNSMATAPASFKLNGTPAGSGQDISMNMVQVGLGVTWH